MLKCHPIPTQDNLAEAKKLTGIRVLAVDDEADSLSLLAFILEQEGAKVTTATSATEAIKILSESTFDLLISDIGMPDVNGYELMRQIRSMPSQAAIRGDRSDRLCRRIRPTASKGSWFSAAISPNPLM